MNICVYANIGRKSFHWKPTYQKTGWGLKPTGKVWYINWAWLFFGGQFDNEK